MSEVIATKLDEARALIEKGWAQGAFARDANDRVIGCEEQNASSFCMAGALMRVTPSIYNFERLVEPLYKVIGDRRIDQWNDAPERTQAEVIEAFRKAAELARGDLVDPLEQVRS